MTKTDSERLALGIKLKNYFDLSLLDLITLEILLNQKKPIKRHSLYLEVNDFLLNRNDTIILKDLPHHDNLMDLVNKYIKEINAISTSSFYNNLITLEKKGLLKFIHNKKKIKAVEKTGITFFFIKFVFNNLLQSIIFNIFKIPAGSAKMIQEKYDLKNFDSVLIILLDEFQDIEFEYLYKISKNLTILTEKPQYRRHFKGLNNVTFATIDKGVIREPEDFFDGIYIGRIQKNLNLYGLTTSKLVKEAIRVLKPGGYFIFSTFLYVESIDNMYADILLNLYNELNSNLIFTEEELRSLLKSNGINDVRFLEFKGLLITIGFKPKN